MGRPSRPIRLFCLLCQAPFSPTRTMVSRGRRYCSRRCSSIAVSGAASRLWRGGVALQVYRLVKARGHHRAKSNGYVPEHILIAERAIGRPLPRSVPVHHVNEHKHDNRPENLVVCQDEKYHRLLHARARILKAGGVPGRDKICGLCHMVKPLTEFYPYRKAVDGRDYRCGKCRRQWAKSYRGGGK